MQYTSAEAGKLVKKLEERMRLLINTEVKSATFNAASGEDVESLRPKYDFAKTHKEIEELTEKIRTVKHAINEFNVSHTLPGFDDITIDQALICIPQLRQRKDTLKAMIARLPKERVNSFMHGNIIDYTIINYDLDEVEKAYNEYEEKLSAMQIALDTINATEKMEIDVVLE